MTQSEKIKIVLKKAFELYSTQKNREFYDLTELFKQADLIVDYQEILNIGKRLEGDGLFNFALHHGKTGHPHIQFTSFGIDFCERGPEEAVEQPAIEVAKKPTKEAKRKPNQEPEQIPVAETPQSEEIKPNISYNEVLPKREVPKTPTPLNLVLQLIEIQISVHGDKSIPEDVRMEIFERIDELSIYLNVTQKIPKRALMDFVYVIKLLPTVEMHIPELLTYMPQPTEKK